MKKSPDVWLFTAAVILWAVGIFMVFDASYARAGQGHYTGGDSYYYVKRQVLFSVVGFVMMFAAMRVRYWKLRPFGFTLMLLSIIGLGLVFVPGLGKIANGASRWIHFAGITIQPSEFAKIGLVLYLASLLSGKRQEIRDWKKGLPAVLIPLGLMGGLVMKQPDMGTTIVLTATTLVMVFMAGGRLRHLAVMVLVGAVLGTALIATSAYRRERILSFMDPFEDYHGGGYQVCQSLIGLGSGGLLGVGLCEGKEKLFYLPAEHTDFIMAVLGEETGFVGAAFVAFLFLFLGARGLSVAYNTKDDFGRLLAGGISVLIAGQALMNMYVVTSSVPATGVPLPLISYGGSSLALNLLCVGVLIGVSSHTAPVKGEP
jgi:cell division protein FtsW